MCSVGIRIFSTSQLDDINSSLSSDSNPNYSDSESDCSSCENSDKDFKSQPTMMLRIPLTYYNHGSSRHALLHLTWFWAICKGRWQNLNTMLKYVIPNFQYMAAHPIQSGLPSCRFGSSRTPMQHHLAQQFKPKSEAKECFTALVLCPMTVHPRHGDIAICTGHTPTCVSWICLVGLWRRWCICSTFTSNVNGTPALQSWRTAWTVNFESVLDHWMYFWFVAL